MGAPARKSRHTTQQDDGSVTVTRTPILSSWNGAALDALWLGGEPIDVVGLTRELHEAHATGEVEQDLAG